MRRLLHETVSEDDLRAVIAELVIRAKAGEPWAVRELLDRTLGKVKPAPDSESEPEGPLLSGNDLSEPLLQELTALAESLPPELLSQRIRDWIQFCRPAPSGPHGSEMSLECNALAFAGIERRRRRLLESRAPMQTPDEPLEALGALDP